MNDRSISTSMPRRSAAAAVLLFSVLVPATAAAAPSGTPTPPSPAAPAEDEVPAADEVAPDGENGGEGESQASPPAASEDAAAIDPARLQQLDDEARALHDRLAQARTRVALVASKLYEAKIELELRSNLERFYFVRDFTIDVDGAPAIHRDEGLGATDGPLFELFAAPGSHRITVLAELVSKRNEHYRVRLEQEFTVVVPEASVVTAKLRLRETGNLFAGFDRRKRGRYETGVRLDVRAKLTKEGKRRARGRAGGAASASATAPGGSGRAAATTSTPSGGDPR